MKGAQARGTRVSAVITGTSLMPWNVATIWPRLWPNPWAAHPLSAKLSFPTAMADEQGVFTYEDRAKARSRCLACRATGPVPRIVLSAADVPRESPHDARTYQGLHPIAGDARMASMLRRRRAEREFRREAKRLAKHAEPAVREASEAIYRAFSETAEMYEVQGFVGGRTNFLKHWVVKKRRRLFR